jgi:16S rRNA (adenine1518-N6/adenine1519-N6)-dimethyltransferase
MARRASNAGAHARVRVTSRRRRRFGQHFLADRGAVRAIVDALAAEPGDVVVEIGSGRGALTTELLERGTAVVAIELDPRLVSFLRATAHPRLTVVPGDVLQRTFRDLADAAGTRPGRLVVAGNLPYSISKPVAMKLVRERDDVARAVLMFQREVAQRIVAGPGGRDYGPLSVLTHRTFDVRCRFDLAPGAFRPPPRVWSTVTTWEPRASNASFDEEAEQRLRHVLAIAFARRRRTLHNNLRATGADASRVDRLLAAAGIEAGVRPERVTPEQFERLAAAWPLPGAEDPS